MTDSKRREEFLRLIQKLTEPEQRALLRLMRRMDLYETLLGAIPVSAEKIQDLIQKYTQQGNWDSVLLLLWKSQLIQEADVGSASSKS